ncbi:MAG TPA: ATP-binding protein [Acidimicrobiales bacterium]|nr:ATP-binding protein [Acidimicrobiales bacterium]
MSSRRRSLLGAVVALGTVAALCAVMFPLRSRLSIATTALVLVVPVVLAVAVGGFRAGALAVTAGFLADDLFFIPPYGTLSVGEAANWTALGVYVVVMLITARVVARVEAARAEARRREAEARHLLELSEVLIGGSPLPELLGRIVLTLQQAFALRSAALLLPVDGTLRVAAAAGEPLSPDELRAVSPTGGERRSVVATTSAPGALMSLPLAVSGRPVGLLVAAGAEPEVYDGGLLRTYANQAALALERSQLREQALRAELLEEVDRWRGALMGAVSHDLRTPLAAVKAAVSDLRRPDVSLSTSDVDELLELIEMQADRLARLVTNLLDMTRIQAGALELRREPTALPELVAEGLAALGSELAPGRVESCFEPGLPLVDVDHLLVAQVLANLLENADRHAPEGSVIEVRARREGDVVEVLVEDHGPGISETDRERVFQMFNRISGGGRAGLGLAIARAFVEAHGQKIRAEEVPGGGARFVFALPVAHVPAEVL